MFRNEGSEGFEVRILGDLQGVCERESEVRFVRIGRNCWKCVEWELSREKVLFLVKFVKMRIVPRELD